MPESAEKRLERKLAKVYAEAQKDMQEKLDKYIVKFRKEDAQKRQDVAAGIITQSEYDEWRKGAIFQGKMWRAKVKQITDSLADANTQSLRLIRGEQMQTFAEGLNHEQYVLEQNTGMSVNFGLYDADTVSRLVRDEPDLLPKKTLNRAKDSRWNHKKVTSAVLQGIIQGESIDDIAKRIALATSQQNRKAMIRYARTATTSAQNAGRMETMHRAQGMGINIRKQWLATLDSRTRDSHQHMDGQTVDVDDKFGNGLMYPGDPNGPAAEVYNCRCTLVYVYPDYPASPGYRLDNETGEHVRGDITYDEWAGNKLPPPQKDESAIIQRIKDLISNHSGEWSTDDLQVVGNNMAEAIELRKPKDMSEIDKEIKEADDEQVRLLAEYRKLNMEYMQARAYKQPDAAEKYNKAREAYNIWSAARDKRIDMEVKKTEQISSAVRSVISDIRPVGGVTEANRSKFMEAGRKSKTTEMLTHAMNHYPSAWLQKSAENSKTLKPKWTTGRAYYSPKFGEIRVDDRPGTNIHELGHRFEYTVPGIMEAEKAYYEKRTAGESSKWLGYGYGRSEVTKRDKFINAYMGKDYGGDGYELVSMGFQMAFTEYDKLSTDPDMRDWILGILSCL